MKVRFAPLMIWLVAMLVLAGCGPAPVATQAPAVAEPTTAPETARVVNRAGVELPPDAAPLDQQVMRYAESEATWLTWDASVYDENVGDMYAWPDSCVRPDEFYEPQPNACTSWEVSDDGLTWTFHLQEDKIWSDDTPVTADDWVFTLQRYARADYDFEWFYSMAGIVNWGGVVSGDVPPEELGVKAVDDYTFTITTERPAPYLIKIMADVWVVPKHIVKDRLDDGTWAFNEENWVSCGPYIMEAYEKGKQLVFVANDKYTGPFPPLNDKIVVSFMEPEVRWTTYKNGELDAIGGGYQADLPPSAMAEVMANPELQKQLIAWPNFITYYLFFDTWNPPFDNLLVRQAFSHAVNRDLLVEGPLKYQAVPAYSMNPPGFPGESVEELKSVQAFDPALAASLLEQAGYPGGQGFPNLTLYTREADPALLSAAEAIAAMIKENLGVTVEVQDLEYSIYMESMYKQKGEKGGDFVFGIVPYEFDFVDGSNLLSVWGGCETEGADMSEMPGRHTWYNQDYNKLLCDAGVIFGDEEQRNELYAEAERMLLEDVALVPVYHGIFVAMVKPDIRGKMLELGEDGVITWMRHRFSSRESLIYRSTQPRE
ncbi:MAG: peptide ABC transporter substrate-binding protein [Chloroflexi bacterium]|nr:MAG: peptide ABC transporter substrate-binding protein [Chloroflexota bacterium]